MSQCHHTESPARTSGIPVTACISNGCHFSLAGKTLPTVTPHMSSSGTSVSSGRSIRYAIASGIGTVCSTPWSWSMSDSAVQPWKVRNAERHRRTGVLRPGGAVRGVPRVVLLDRAVEQVPERALVGLGHPQIEGAGIEVGAQTGGVRARGPAPDPVRVEAVAVGLEPHHTVGLVTPATVEERLHAGHALALAGLHLGGRPVDRVDLGLRADGAEEVVAGAAVGLEEPVALDVVDDGAHPTPAPARAGNGRGRPRSRAAAAWPASPAVTVPAAMSA